MVDKEMDWPVAPGDYEIGTPKSPVAIVFFGSKNVIIPPKFYAIKGTCCTENFGIEKVIVNIISNPNIRYLLLCGGEILGHFTRDSLKALHKNGVDEKGKIIGAKGKIPYIVNIPTYAIDRFRDQIELIDLTGNREALRFVRGSYKVEEFPVDLDELIKTIEVCMMKKPEKYGEPIVIQVGPLQSDSDVLDREVMAFSQKLFAQRVGLATEKLTTKADFIWISSEFTVFLNPVLGDISMVAIGMNFMRRLMEYYRI